MPPILPFYALSCTSADFVEVVMGAHNIRKAEPTQVTLRSVDFFTHEDWNAANLINDIAIIRLPSAVTFNGKQWVL